MHHILIFSIPASAMPVLPSSGQDIYLTAAGWCKYLEAGSRPGGWKRSPPLTPGGRSLPLSAGTPTSLTCGGAAERDPGPSLHPGALASSSVGPPLVLT